MTNKIKQSKAKKKQKKNHNTENVKYVQHRPRQKKWGVNSGVREGQAIFAPYKTPVMLVVSSIVEAVGQMYFIRIPYYVMFGGGLSLICGSLGIPVSSNNRWIYYLIVNFFLFIK